MFVAVNFFKDAVLFVFFSSLSRPFVTSDFFSKRPPFRRSVIATAVIHPYGWLWPQQALFNVKLRRRRKESLPAFHAFATLTDTATIAISLLTS